MKCDDIDDILISWNLELSNINNLTDLNKIGSLYIGRYGKINKLFKTFNDVPLEKKKDYIKKLNNIKTVISKNILVKKTDISNNQKKQKFDVTVPSKGCDLGSLHIINQSIYKIYNFFSEYGFIIEAGKEIDTAYYNFDALNMPIDHPARNIKDTFYINDYILLRTHTSNMQIHLMKKLVPPIKVLSYGKVYRRDYDITHTPMFHQIEGLVVDVNISLGNLKFIILEFFKFFFNEPIDIKFRSSYFPFTEPSFEVDIKCVHCLGSKCYFCKNSGWLEVLGCGVVHPFILKECKINSNIYTGIAFGLGVERLTMIKHKINDIKLFFENNLDFLKQF